MASGRSRESYHHGTLREELVRAAIETVGAKGVEGLSVAEAARALGVSPGAPYRHFRDRDALLAAAATAATEQLAAAYREALASTDDPVEQLAAVSAAYVRLSAATGAGFEIVYASGLDKAAHPDLARGTRELSALVLPIGIELAEDHEGALRLLASQMALAHGYAGLLRSGFFSSHDETEGVARDAAEATRALLNGYGRA